VNEIVIIGDPVEIREFAKADEIARGLSPFNQEHAALVDRKRREKFLMR
jgi:hypothetical protein